MLLSGKCGIITGAGGGMGRAAVELFAREGAAIMCADIDANGAAEIAASIACSTQNAAPSRAISSCAGCV